MTRRYPQLLLALALVLGSACATAGTTSTPGTSPAARSDSKTVTEEELAGVVHLNLYDYLAAERPRWLRVPMPSNLPVLVFMDDTRLGGIQTLRTLSTNTVRMLRYYEPSAAQQKFAGRDVGAVIQVLIK